MKTLLVLILFWVMYLANRNIDGTENLVSKSMLVAIIIVTLFGIVNHFTI